MPYPEDARLREETLALLGLTWPNLPPAVDRARRWGADWCEVSTPFVREDEGEVVCVVGVLTMPLRIAGRDVEIAGVHGVCTHPAHRRRGHFRHAMEEALAFVDARYETSLLYTDQPELYEPFGFRLEAERVWRGPAPQAMGDAAGGRRIDLDTGADLALIRTLLGERAPVSEALGTRDPGWHFLIDMALLGRDAPELRYVPELDAVLAIERDGELVVLADVIARELPPIEAIVPHLPRGAELEIAFDTSSTGSAGLAPAAHAHDVDRFVRGPWPAGHAPLSPLTQC